jgi:hypothetical protein
VPLRPGTDNEGRALMNDDQAGGVALVLSTAALPGSRRQLGG